MAIGAEDRAVHYRSVFGGTEIERVRSFRDLHSGGLKNQIETRLVSRNVRSTVCNHTWFEPLRRKPGCVLDEVFSNETLQLELLFP